MSVTDESATAPTRLGGQLPGHDPKTPTSILSPVILYVPSVLMVAGTSALGGEDRTVCASDIELSLDSRVSLSLIKLVTPAAPESTSTGSAAPPTVTNW
ncbi:MAG TPA: hypothetical protein VK511_09730 [Gemmatimonadaceae bacterium]|nr:hypothetical protein [Gemmatimonadaceae bacterium]